MSNRFSQKGNLELRPPSQEEQDILEKLLTGKFPGKKALLSQLIGLTARQIDDDGSLQLVPPADAPRAEVKRRIPVEAELPDRDGVVIHVLLHVLDGCLAELEVYRDDSAPVQRELSPNAFDLIVL